MAVRGHFTGWVSILALPLFLTHGRSGSSRRYFQNDTRASTKPGIRNSKRPLYLQGHPGSNDQNPKRIRCRGHEDSAYLHTGIVIIVIVIITKSLELVSDARL